MKTLLSILLIIFFLITNIAMAQHAQHVWDSIKSITMPVTAPAFQNEFNAPYKQPLADYGWEDGLQISEDGCSLYALYSPMDLFSWTQFFTSHLQQPLCTSLSNMRYIRPYANTYGMDMVTNSFGCDSFANIDILYAHRNSVNAVFNTWQLSNIARPGAIEGSPAPLFSASNPIAVDLFFFTGNGDIWVIKNTTANPAGINNAIRLPSPINADSNEFSTDNPFAARINGDTIILIYEKYTNPAARIFMFTMSSDAGNTWAIPQSITAVTNSLGHIEHPCLHKDNTNQWYLYFSIDYSSIVRSKQTIAGNWNSWAAPETIITKGNAVSIGEPTVTQNGDISFSLGYKNTVINDSNDVYDLDPWFLPHKTTGIFNNSVSDDLKLNVFPNPFEEEINIEFRLQQESIVRAEIVNVLGETAALLIADEKKSAGITTLKLNSEKLSPGIYICKIKAGNYFSSKTIVKQ